MMLVTKKATLKLQLKHPEIKEQLRAYIMQLSKKFEAEGKQNKK